MSKFLTRERFGRPQVLAGFLLLGFLAQCGWLLVRGTEPNEVESSQLFRVVEGLQQWSGDSIAGTPSVERMEAGTPTPPEVEQNDGYDPNHSPLWYLLASVPLLVKNDFHPSPGAMEETFRAKAACGSVANTVETCWSLSTCAWTAWFTFSLQWPTLTVRMPPKKSRYWFPSASHTN